MAASEQEQVHTLFVPSGSQSPCGSLLQNHGYPTLGGSSVPTNPVVSNIRLLSYDFHKQHRRKGGVGLARTSLSVNIYAQPYKSISPQDEDEYSYKLICNRSGYLVIFRLNFAWHPVRITSTQTLQHKFTYNRWNMASSVIQDQRFVLFASHQSSVPPFPSQCSLCGSNLAPFARGYRYIWSVLLKQDETRVLDPTDSHVSYILLPYIVVFSDC